jgi:hypothetical protein
MKASKKKVKETETANFIIRKEVITKGSGRIIK